MIWKTIFKIHFWIIFILLVILVLNVAYARPVTFSKFLGEADGKYRGIAEEYLKQKLGNDYFNEYLDFHLGDKHEDCVENKSAIINCTNINVIYFTYNNKATSNIKIDETVRYRTNVTSGVKTGFRGISILSSIRVEVDDNGNVVKYSGPSKPYNFLITKDDVINKAKSYGYNAIIDATLVGIPRSDGYEILWVVDSSDLLECRWEIYFESASTKLCSFKGVYIDVDTGEIRGEYDGTYYSAFGNIVRSQPNGIEVSLPTDSKLYEFFEKQDTSNSNEIKSPYSNIGIKSLAIMIIIIILIVGFLMWYRLHRK
jgi:hypothetical protein